MMPRLKWSIVWSFSWILLFSATTAQAQAVRIVSVNGSVTEIIYALGAEQTLVGVDTTSQYPVSALKLRQVGYQRNLSIEGILSLKPTHILATTSAGPPTVVRQLRASGVELIQFEEQYDLGSIIERIQMIAQLVGQEEKGQVLVEKLKKQFAEVENSIQKRSQRGAEKTHGATTSDHSQALKKGVKKVLFVLAIGSGSPLAAGKKTAANAMIELAGGVNIFTDFEGYKPVNPEVLAAAAPDAILIVSHGAEKNNVRMVDKVRDIPAVSVTPAGQQKQIRVVDGLRFLGFGPRAGEALQDFHAYLYPAAQFTR